MILDILSVCALIAIVIGFADMFLDASHKAGLERGSIYIWNRISDIQRNPRIPQVAGSIGPFLWPFIFLFIPPWLAGTIFKTTDGNLFWVSLLAGAAVGLPANYYVLVKPKSPRQRYVRIIDMGLIIVVAHLTIWFVSVVADASVLSLFNPCMVSLEWNWLSTSSPYLLTALVSAAIWFLEVITRKIAEYPKGPMLGLSAIVGGVAQLLKVFV